MKLGLLAVPLLVFVVACRGGGDDPDAPAIEQSIRSMIDAWNQQDVDRFLASWTSSGLNQRFGANEAQLRERGQDFLGEPRREIREISNISVRAGSGFAEVEFAAGRAIYTDRYIVVQQGGTWRIDAADQVEPDVGGGTTLLEVEMRESAFQFDPEDTEDGDIAVKAENMGTQPHQLTLWRVPNDFNIETALANGAANATPSGVEVIGSTGPVAPEGTGYFALVDPLEEGRYVLICLLPDTASGNDVSHAERGMVGEFEVTNATAFR